MKQKTPQLGADARAQIAQTLPMAMKKAIASYQDFIDGHADDTDSNDYKNKQTAAKAGLAHIELLMKLASMVDALDDGEVDDFYNLLADAKKELEGKNE